MATPYQVHVTPSNSGLLNVKQTDASAAKVTQLLQADLEKHHVFFNTEGFHNHIPHHLLALYGTGATPDAIQKAFDENASYQIKASRPRDDVVKELEDDWAANASKYLGLGKHYASFLVYFQRKIEKLGWEQVLLEHAFNGDEKSEQLFGRLFAGFMHPIIQLMYGIEWQQPAIIAEGLAQTAVHQDRLTPFLERAEEAAKARGPVPYSLADLTEAVRKNEKLATSAHWEDPNRILDGVLVRAPDEAIDLIANVSVAPEDLEEKTVEMFHNAAYVATAAAFHPPHIPKVDFFLMHHINSAPVFLSINKLSWVPIATKVRLLEWKMRLDLVEFAARRCPPLRLDSINQYKPKDEALVSKPEDLLPRFHDILDDGHLIKLVRALLIAQDLSRKYAGRPWIRIADDDTWLRAHYILLEGGQLGEPFWVRTAGLDEAWENVPKAE